MSKTPKTQSHTHVYVAAFDRTGPCLISVSDDPVFRVACERKLPWIVTVLWISEPLFHQEAKALMNAAHKKLWDNHLQNHWFEVFPDAALAAVGGELPENLRAEWGSLDEKSEKTDQKSGVLNVDFSLTKPPKTPRK